MFKKKFFFKKSFSSLFCFVCIRRYSFKFLSMSKSISSEEKQNFKAYFTKKITAKSQYLYFVHILFTHQNVTYEVMIYIVMSQVSIMFQIQKRFGRRGNLFLKSITHQTATVRRRTSKKQHIEPIIYSISQEPTEQNKQKRIFKGEGKNFSLIRRKHFRKHTFLHVLRW